MNRDSIAAGLGLLALVALGGCATGGVRGAGATTEAFSEKGPVGEPRRRKQASRSAARRSASSEAQYAPEGPRPDGNADQ